MPTQGSEAVCLAFTCSLSLMLVLIQIMRIYLTMLQIT